MKNQRHMAFSSDTQRWKALVERDWHADGAFFYGVKTTGVYCRPTCSSRMPERANIVFFTSFLEAEKAGFRPCKRCLPNTASPREARMEIVIRTCKSIEEAEELPKLEDLAAAVGLSPSHFHRVFKEIVGVTPKEYAAALRERRVRGCLTQRASITDAIYDAGFNASSRFYEKSTELLGMTPTSYRNEAAGLRIRVAVAESFLGWTLVAATDLGICSIEFGDTPELMIERLRRRFPKADLDENDPDFGDWVSKVMAFLEAPEDGLDVPLDIQGTAFQKRVWKALKEIVPGSTRTYTEVASAIGKPKAARAVARAIASNKIAVAIPCHRVVRSNGDLGGYRWGIDRKQALLQHEVEAIKDHS
jgi:AraC family transcriptional regulator, regulatory protein of adaptative response / methylated-DNA-[protein]-cysteine methyltransferase